MKEGDIVSKGGKKYVAVSFNLAINQKRTNTTDPCTLCAIDWKAGNKCDEIKCIDGNEFFYLKEYGEKSI